MTALAQDSAPAPRPGPLGPVLARFDPWTMVWMGVFGALAGYAYCLWIFLDSGEWWINPGGLPADLDFVCFWAAGKLAVAGAALEAYHPARLAVWSEHARSYPFFYPPVYLLMVAPLGLLPFTAAAAAAVGTTGAAYLLAIRAILPRGAVVALAAVAPAAFFNVYVGQNGLLTAALFGGALALLDRRPVLAGLLIAVLAYKPQYGLLIPLVLLLTGRRRVFISAALGVLALNGLAALILGWEAFPAFLEAMQSANGKLLHSGGLPWWKIQSLYGAARWAGLSAPLAWSLHAALALPVAAGLLLLWRGRAPFALKAAALPVATLLVSPYGVIYDFVILTVPVVYLIRDAERTPLLPLEIAALAVALLLPLFVIIGSLPLGVFAGLALAVVIVRRWRKASAEAPAALSPSPCLQTTSPSLSREPPHPALSPS